MNLRPIRELPSARDGVTVVEFALVLPVLMIVVFGLFDLAYNMYTAQMLQGALQKAARDSTIEGADTHEATLDQRVITAVRAIAPGATVEFDRRSYSNFTGVNRPEDYTDVNANNTCDDGEPFEDANGNGSWDMDPGKTGFGGARDAVLYTATITYKRPFPIVAFIPGQTGDFTLVANTVLRNQPYGLQDTTPPRTGNCT